MRDKPRLLSRSTDATKGADEVGFGGQYGYYTDPETGLVLCTHRYYDPGAGRWLTRDPISYKDGMNLYSYAGGNPINRIDPDGTDDYGADPGDYFDLNKYFSNIFDNHSAKDYLNAAKRKINRVKYKIDHDAGAQCMGVYLSLISLPADGPEEAVIGSKAVIQALEAEKEGVGVTVLGSFPKYVQTAEAIGAKYFQLPTKIWNSMPASESWAANLKFLKRAIARGDKIILTNNGAKAGATTSLYREIEYMKTRGYILSRDGFSLIKPGK